MDTSEHPAQAPGLAPALQAREAALTRCREALEAQPAQMAAHGPLVAKLRGMNTSDPARLKALSKDLARLLNPLSYGARHQLAVAGAAEGLARLVVGHLEAFSLQSEHSFEALLVCAQEEPELTLSHLDGHPLAPEQLKLLMPLACSQQPALDFEEFKKVEILVNSGDRDVPLPGDVVRRHDQLRGLRSRHLRRHLLGHLPKDLREDPLLFELAITLLLDRDPYGTLEHLREEKQPQPLGTLSLDTRMGLLERVAARGLGLASNYLDLFGVTEDPDLHPFLQRIFCADLTAGSSIFGAYALEGAPHYPFDLGRIEPMLPRRITQADAQAYLEKGMPDTDTPRTFRPAEIEKAMEVLQDRQALRFLETLKADLGRNWKHQYPEAKREVIFGDPDLKIRNILYLVAHGTFMDSQPFEQLLSMIQEQFPEARRDPLQGARLANRYFFLDLLGLNPGLLFAVPQKGANRKALIEEVSDYQIRAFLHAGMSIHLRVGDQLFKAMPIAWPMLVNQYDHPGQAMQGITTLLEAIDMLLTLAEPVVPELEDWLGSLVDALTQGNAQVPDPAPCGPAKSPLRLPTRATVDRYRDLLNSYCLQMIHANAARQGKSSTTIIQNLRMPRNRTDKLFAMLEAERQQQREGGSMGHRKHPAE